MGSPPPSAAGNSAAQPQIDGDSGNGVSLPAEEKKPDVTSLSFDEDLDRFEDVDKYNKYEADYTCRLMAKYFSEKDVSGGEIFDEEITVYGEIIKASRYPSTSSYINPLSVFRDLSCCGISVAEAEEGATLSNGKQPLKK